MSERAKKHAGSVGFLAEVKPLCGAKARKGGRDHLFSDKPNCRRCIELVAKMRIVQRTATRAANARREGAEE